jgi:hypothetical protein
MVIELGTTGCVESRGTICRSRKKLRRGLESV